MRLPRPRGRGRPPGRSGAHRVKAHQPAVVLPEADRLAGVGNISFHKGARGRIWLKIVPEGPFFDVYRKARKAGHGLIHRPLKGLRVHPLLHHRGKAVDGGIVFLLDRGVEHAGIVQLIPLLLSAFSGSHSVTSSWIRSLLAFHFITPVWKLQGELDEGRFGTVTPPPSVV